ncbi:MAG: hypothetical protein QME55_13745, partial [Brevundimonas sp.]|nr:hypothetical protein [Brevundimonas sp.]
MRRLIRLLATGVTAALWAGSVHAQTAASAEGWRQLARADLDAAHALILENHPGAVPELGDESFRQRMRLGYDTALGRIPAVDGYAGYTAVLAGFATSFGDEHVWSNPRLRGVPYAWAGLVMTRRGGTWVVAARDGDDQSLVGARLASCDG